MIVLLVVLEKVSGGSAQFVAADNILVVRLIDYFVSLFEEFSHLLTSAVWVPIVISIHPLSSRNH